MILRTPSEISTKGSAQFDGVTQGELLGKKRRYFAVGYALDGDFDQRDAPAGRGDRIAALCLISVVRCQPHVYVLASEMSGPLRQRERDGPDGGGLIANRGNGG